jgi:hypothetical protein
VMGAASSTGRTDRTRSPTGEIWLDNRVCWWQACPTRLDHRPSIIATTLLPILRVMRAGAFARKRTALGA